MHEQARIEDCRNRFNAAVREGRRGHFGSASQIVESIRKANGDATADIAKRELWAYIRSDKPA